MRHTPRGLPIPNRIEALDEQAFSWLHTIAVVPRLIWMVLEVE